MLDKQELKSGQIYRTDTGWYFMIIEVDKPGNFKALHIADRFNGRGDYGFLTTAHDGIDARFPSSKLVAIIDAKELEKVLRLETSEP